MKLRPFFAALCLIAPLSTAQEQDSADYTTKVQFSSQEEALNYLAPIGIQLVQRLTTIQSKEEADALAADWARFEQHLEQLAAQKQCSMSALRNRMNDAGYGLDYVMNALGTLEEQHFYGSVTLPEAFGIKAAPVEEALPDTIREQLEQELTHIVHAHQLPLTGGPGFSMETAWKLSKDAPNPQKAMDTLINSLPNTRVELEMASRQGDKSYHGYYAGMLHQDKKYNIEIWFDITDCVDTLLNTPREEPVPYELSEAEKEILAQLSDAFRQLAQQLNSISNKAEADAAAPQVKKLMQQCNNLVKQCAYPQTVLEQVDMKPMSQAAKKLEGHKFYQSFKLGNALGLPNYAIMEPIPLTPELEQILVESMQQTIREQNLGLTGGPGFTEENAWISEAEEPPFRELIDALPCESPQFFSEGNSPSEDGTTEMTNRTYFFIYQDKVYELNLYIRHQENTSWY